MNETLTNNPFAQRAYAAGQGHVFRFWNELDGVQRDRLMTQVKSIDFELLKKLKTTYIDNPANRVFKGEIAPADVIRIPRTDIEIQNEQKAKQLGESLLRSGKVAALLVAGGLGTRLGFDAPKGTFPIGPVSSRSLFQYHAEKLVALSRRYQSKIPWYIMTSDHTNKATIEFFEEKDYFGLPQKDVIFFNQGMLPGLDEQGRLILTAKDYIFTNPDGHGGTIKALEKSGALADMHTRGIEYIFYFQVDNVLVKMCDPIFLGYHLQQQADMSAKVTPKRDPNEGLGIIGRIAGRVGVIEYSDLKKEDKEARKNDGRLKYTDGSIAIHILSVRFLDRLLDSEYALPFHLAHKSIPFLNRKGQTETPDSPNGFKFEHFIFDALAQARKVAIMEVKRKEEFSPVKNKQGVDSPDTARQDISSQFGKWLESAGVQIPRDSKGNVTHKIEISPLFALDREELLEKITDDFHINDQLLIE